MIMRLLIGVGAVGWLGAAYVSMCSVAVLSFPLSNRFIQVNHP